MKLQINATLAFSSQARICGLLFAGLFLCHGQVNGADTNWSWLNFSLSIPKTSFVVGEKIPASIVVSNITNEGHLLRWRADDPCGCGFGKFLIIGAFSTKTNQCKFSPDSSFLGSRQILLESHTSKSFEFDLAAMYFFTNTEPYSVIVKGWFPINGETANRQYFTVQTPAIVIQLSSKGETNTPSKSP